MLPFDRVSVAELAHTLRVPAAWLAEERALDALHECGLMVESAPDGSPYWDRVDVDEETDTPEQVARLRQKVEMVQLQRENAQLRQQLEARAQDGRR